MHAPAQYPASKPTHSVCRSSPGARSRRFVRPGPPTPARPLPRPRPHPHPHPAFIAPSHSPSFPTLLMSPCSVPPPPCSRTRSPPTIHPGCRSRDAAHFTALSSRPHADTQYLPWTPPPPPPVRSYPCAQLHGPVLACMASTLPPSSPPVPSHASPSPTQACASEHQDRRSLLAPPTHLPTYPRLCTCFAGATFCRCLCRIVPSPTVILPCAEHPSANQLPHAALAASFLSPPHPPTPFPSLHYQPSCHSSTSRHGRGRLWHHLACCRQCPLHSPFTLALRIAWLLQHHRILADLCSVGCCSSVTLPFFRSLAPVSSSCNFAYGSDRSVPETHRIAGYQKRGTLR